MANKRRNELESKEERIRDLEQEIRRLKRQLREYHKDNQNNITDNEPTRNRGPKLCVSCGKGSLAEVCIDLPTFNLYTMTCTVCNHTERLKVPKDIPDAKKPQ